MIDDGLAGELYNLAAPHGSTLGLTMRMTIPFSSLICIQMKRLRDRDDERARHVTAR